MNIYTNVVAPVAASRMTETIMPEDVLAGIGPANIVPLSNIYILNIQLLYYHIKVLVKMDQYMNVLQDI